MRRPRLTGACTNVSARCALATYPSVTSPITHLSELPAAHIFVHLTGTSTMSCSYCPRLGQMTRCAVCWLGRLTKSSTDLVFSAILLLFYWSAILPARSTELNRNRPHVRKRVRFKTACPKFVVSFSLKILAQNYLFSTTAKISSNFNNLCLRNETRYKQLGNALETAHSPLRRPKIS